MRDNEHADHGQTDIKGKHHEGNADEQEQLLEQAGHHVAKQLGHALHIVVDAGHKFPHGILTKKGLGTGQDMMKQGRPDILHHQLPCAFKINGLHVGGRQQDNSQGGKQDSHADQSICIPPPKVL